MRTTFAFTVLAAIGVQAVPQSVQPISQISDGQIQAPPATAAPVSSYAPVVPSVSSAAAPVITSAVVVPSVPVIVPTAPAGGNSTAPAVSTGAPSYPNSTVAISSGAAPTTAGGSTPSPSAPPSQGAAALNMVSFGGLVAAVAAFVFA